MDFRTLMDMDKVAYGIGLLMLLGALGVGFLMGRCS